MVTQSIFSRWNKKQLVIIARELIDNGFEAQYPYDEYDNNYNELKSVLKVLSEETNDEDVQFFAKFIHINDEVLAKIFETNDKSLYDSLIIPMAKGYRINYDVTGSATITYHYRDTIDCYDKNWVSSSVSELEMDGNWYMGDGIWEGEEIDDFQYSTMSINDIVEIADNNKIESVLGKLVVENTSDIIDNLDKTTLLKLKEIIDQKLRSL